MNFDTIESAIEDIRQGKMIVVVDDEDRENEGDLLMARSWLHRSISISWQHTEEV